jgi:hypothetical protein
LKLIIDLLLIISLNIKMSDSWYFTSGRVTPHSNFIDGAQSYRAADNYDADLIIICDEGLKQPFDPSTFSQMSPFA